MSDQKSKAAEIIANTEGWTPEQAFVLYTTVEALREQFRRENTKNKQAVPTQRELDLVAALSKANSLLRSCRALVHRRGQDTRWEAISDRLDEVLSEQHKILYEPTPIAAPDFKA